MSSRGRRGRWRRWRNRLASAAASSARFQGSDRIGKPIRKRLPQIFEAQVETVEKAIAEARERGEATVGDTRKAARSVVAQLEGQVLFAKLYNDPQHLEALWANCLTLLSALSARRPDEAAVSS
ncbi:TetR family transcriptional regulator C-terminal domain-containing protein [Streptomyces sp. NPDC055134]